MSVREVKVKHNQNIFIRQIASTLENTYVVLAESSEGHHTLSKAKDILQLSREGKVIKEYNFDHIIEEFVMTSSCSLAFCVPK